MNALTSAARPLLKSPRFSLLAIAVIGLGVGACTTAYTLFETLLLRDRPGMVDEERLVDIGRTENGVGFDNFSYPDYLDYRSGNSTFADIAAIKFTPEKGGLSVDGVAESANPQWVSPNFFVVTGTRIARGRGFTQTDKAEGEIILSDAYWKRRFNGNPEVVGRTVLLNNTPVTIIGVTEPGFTGSTILRADFWGTLQFMSVLNRQNGLLAGRPFSLIMAIGRLREGVTIEQARADLSVIAERIAHDYPDSREGDGIAVTRSTRLPGDMQMMAKAFTGLLGLLTLLIALVASANVAGLVLARGAMRQREFAMRAALGANRPQLVRQLLLEQLLLFAFGGMVGTLFCVWMTKLLSAAIPQLPEPVEIALAVQPGSFVFAMGISLLIGLIFGLGPALSSSRFNLLTILRRGEQPAGARIFGLRGLFLVTQLTLSLALIATAAVLTKSLWRLAQADPGFDVRRVDLVRFDLNAAGLDEANGASVAAQLLERTRTLPEVRSAALSVAVPLQGEGFGFGPLFLPGKVNREDAIGTDWNLVSPGYFATMGIPLLHGRDFAESDRSGSPLVGIVNETLARQVWPNESPVGKSLVNLDGQPIEIIAVARNAKYRTAGEAPRPHFYASYAQHYYHQPSLLVKGQSDLSLIPQLREVVRQVRSDLPVYNAQSLSSAVATALTPRRIAAGVALASGVLALVLAGIGVYALTLFLAATRTREFGLRIALGATRENLIKLALSAGVRLGAVAVVLGLLGGFALTKFSASIFSSVEVDPMLFVAVASLFLFLVLFAAFLPARRAARVDPMIALRAE